MSFHTVNEVEEYIRNVLGIPYVNLDSFHLDVCIEIVSTLEEVFSKYPLLKGTICSIGQREDINNQINLILASDIDEGWKMEDWEEIRKESNFMSCHGTKSDCHITYISLAFLERAKILNLNEQNYKLMWESIHSIHPEHCYDFRSSIWHEIGHIFDYVLTITARKDFLEKLSEINVSCDISKYAATSPRETFAEAFAEYHSTNYPNDAVSSIVEIALQEYKKREKKKSQIFQISKKYKYTK